jgi:hypothetical protein
MGFQKLLNQIENFKTQQTTHSDDKYFNKFKKFQVKKSCFF